MASVFVDHQFSIWNAPGHVATVECGHHDVIIAIGHKNRNTDPAQIQRRLAAPGLNSGKLAQEGTGCRTFAAIQLALFQTRQKVIGCAAPLGVEVKNR